MGIANKNVHPNKRNWIDANSAASDSAVVKIKQRLIIGPLLLQQQFLAFLKCMYFYHLPRYYVVCMTVIDCII